MSVVPGAQALHGPMAGVLWTTPGLFLCTSAWRPGAAPLICLFYFPLSQNVLFRRCHFDSFSGGSEYDAFQGNFFG